MRKSCKRFLYSTGDYFGKPCLVLIDNRQIASGSQDGNLLEPNLLMIYFC